MDDMQLGELTDDEDDDTIDTEDTPSVSCFSCDLSRLRAVDIFFGSFFV